MTLIAFNDEGAPGEAIIQHQRCYVELKLSVGTNQREVFTGLTPHRGNITRGDHTQATEGSVTVFGSVLPFPITQVNSGILSIFLGTTEGPEDEVKDAKNLRFVGWFQNADIATEDRTISIKAQDYSVILREHKPIRQADKKNNPQPLYSDTLEEAIKKVFKVVPAFSGSESEPPLTLRDTATIKRRLDGGVKGRGKTAPVHLKAEWTAWEAIEHLCALVSCHANVDLTELVIRDTDEVFNQGKPKATLIFGDEHGNCFGPTFHKKFITNRKGIRVVAWDPEEMVRVEADFPSDAVLRGKAPAKTPSATKHKPSKNSHKSAKKAIPEPQREIFEIDQGHYTKTELERFAKDLWMQRSNFEVEGMIATPLWTDETLSLQNGNRVRIKIQPEIERQLKEIGDETRAIAFLQERLLVEQAAAEALLALYRNPATDLWYVRRVTIDFPSDKAVTIDFMSLLEIAHA